LIEGIAADQEINSKEIEFLNLWLKEHAALRTRHPYSEIVPLLIAAIEDRVLTSEEKLDLQWVCRKLISQGFYDEITADVQRLHAFLGGIAADGTIKDNEIRGLSEWLEQHEHLKKTWPYEEVVSLVTSILRDGAVSGEERAILDSFCTEFVAVLDTKTIATPSIIKEGSIVGLCSVCPEILFDGRTFCLTGASTRYSRSEFSEKITSLGGVVVNSVSKKLSYLVIGADGNPCWSYACYGRKVEKAAELRRDGSSLLIVHENDLHDAMADY
jgi:hypothetical protein